jgi:hypothetical protein
MPTPTYLTQAQSRTAVACADGAFSWERVDGLISFKKIHPFDQSCIAKQSPVSPITYHPNA